MQGRLFPAGDREFKDHPKFSGVRIAIQISSQENAAVGVSQLLIQPGVEIPAHTHDTQVDSIYVVSGEGEVYLNGSWHPVAADDYIFAPAGAEHGVRNSGDQVLKLFIHHSPPLF